MSFKQLAKLRDRLRAQAAQARPAQAKSSAGHTEKREAVESGVEAIWRLQRHSPLAFPESPAAKVPLEQGILQGTQQYLELLKITAEQLKQTIATWYQGSRYWSCMVEDAPRPDLQGQVADKVTAEQAVHTRRQASRRQREQMHERHAKRAQVGGEVPAAVEAPTLGAPATEMSPETNWSPGQGAPDPDALLGCRSPRGPFRGRLGPFLPACATQQPDLRSFSRKALTKPDESVHNCVHSSDG